MTLYWSLLQRYGTNEPIFVSEISHKSYSRAWIYTQLKQLCAEGRLVRYEPGVYYIPGQSCFEGSRLKSEKVIERKYICQNGETTGYYVGLTLQHRLRLISQRPDLIEVCTNHETTRVRDVLVGTQKVRLRKARTKITSANAGTLSFLELMNSLDVAALNGEKRAIIAEYIASVGVTRRSLSAYAPFFPDKTMRALIESEIIYSIAR